MAGRPSGVLGLAFYLGGFPLTPVSTSACFGLAWLLAFGFDIGVFDISGLAVVIQETQPVNPAINLRHPRGNAHAGITPFS
jgi:hypothetical protein